MTAPTLPEFLLARISEDEAVATRAVGSAWHLEPDEGGVTDVMAGSGIVMPVTVTTANDHDAFHIARHDPARVLAECEAKRRIVALHHLDEDRETGLCIEDAFTYPCETLRWITLPYASHPDYNPDWRP